MYDSPLALGVGVVNLSLVVTDVQVVRFEQISSKSLRGKCGFVSPSPSQTVECPQGDG